MATVGVAARCGETQGQKDNVVKDTIWKSSDERGEATWKNHDSRGSSGREDPDTSVGGSYDVAGVGGLKDSSEHRRSGKELTELVEQSEPRRKRKVETNFE